MKRLQRYVGIISSASVSPFIDFSCRFVRTVILSHILSPVSLGAAIALSAIIGTCEVLADVGISQFVVVSTGSDRAQAVAAAREIGIIRGTLLALFIVAFAPILADVFGAQGHVESIRWLGVIPLLSGFRNWRTTQVQAEYRYLPEAITSCASSFAALAVVIPAAAWFHDERTILVSLVVEAGVRSIVSHMVLKPERVRAVDPKIRRAALTFGLPLMVNGIGLVILSQVDRMIVSNLFGLETLASYSLAIGIAVVPISVIASVMNRVLMAYILRSKSNSTNAHAADFVTAWTPIAVGACYALAIGAVLDFAIPAVYGSQYHVNPGVHALITILVFVRLCRMGVTVLLISTGRTRQMTAANLTAGAGLAIGLILGILFQRLEDVVFGVVLGDIFSFISMLFFLQSRIQLKSTLHHLSTLFLSASLAAAGAYAQPGIVLETRTLIFVAGTLLVCIDVVMVYRRYLKKLLSWKEDVAGKASVP